VLGGYCFARDWAVMVERKDMDWRICLGVESWRVCIRFSFSFSNSESMMERDCLRAEVDGESRDARLFARSFGQFTCIKNGITNVV